MGKISSFCANNCKLLEEGTSSEGLLWQTLLKT